jgi:hypothetical protein
MRFGRYVGLTSSFAEAPTWDPRGGDGKRAHFLLDRFQLMLVVSTDESFELHHGRAHSLAAARFAALTPFKSIATLLARHAATPGHDNQHARVSAALDDAAVS